MKIRVPVSFMVVVIVVIVVGVLTIIRIPCPTCDSTGVLMAPQGLKLERIEGQLLKFKNFDMDCEGVWGVFTYVVNILVTNEQTDPSHGYIVVAFYAPDESSPALKIPVYIEIPAETTENVERILVYSGFVGDVGYDLYEKNPEPHRLETDEIEEEMVCPHCDGKGKLPLNERARLILG